MWTVVSFTLPHTVVGVCGEFQRTGRFLQRGIWSQCVVPRSLKVAQLLRSSACLHTNQSRSYLNHLVLRSSCKLSEILSDFDQMFWVSGKILYNPQYKIPRKSIQWEPRWYVRTDGRTERRTEGRDKTNTRYAYACFNLLLWSTIHLITAVRYNMPHFSEKQTEWRVTAPNYGTRTFTKPRYHISIFIESEHVTPLCASKRGEGGRGEVALFIARPFHNTWISVNSLMSIFSRASPAFGRRSCVFEENKQVTSRSTTCVLIKCLWKNIICVATDDTPFFHHVSYEKTGCVLLNYLCFAGNWNPASTERGFRLIHFLVIWTR